MHCNKQLCWEGGSQSQGILFVKLPAYQSGCTQNLDPDTHSGVNGHFFLCCTQVP